MSTPASTSAAPMLSGYNFATPPQPTGTFDLSSHNQQTSQPPPPPPPQQQQQSSMRGMPPVGPTHLLGGMPNAVMTLDNAGSYDITPEVFEAFAYAEPITTNMTPGFDNEWARPS